MRQRFEPAIIARYHRPKHRWQKTA